MSYDIEGVAEELLGTKQPLSDVVGNHLTEDMGFADALRDHAIQCRECGFWFVPEEVDADDTCEECDA